MSIITRASKGSELTHAELDNNFLELQEHSGTKTLNESSIGDKKVLSYDLGSDSLIYRPIREEMAKSIQKKVSLNYGLLASIKDLKLNLDYTSSLLTNLGQSDTEPKVLLSLQGTLYSHTKESSTISLGFAFYNKTSGLELRSVIDNTLIDSTGSITIPIDTFSVGEYVLVDIDIKVISFTNGVETIDLNSLFSLSTSSLTLI